MEVPGLSRTRNRGTVAVGAIAIIAVFIITLTCIGIVILESNRYNQSAKIANEVTAVKVRERLIVVQVDNDHVSLINEGSSPVLIVGVYRVNPADRNPGYVPLSEPVAVPLLSTINVQLPEAAPEGWTIGVVTSLGNVFWEGELREDLGETVPPGEPVYITFLALGIGSDASGTVLTVDGTSYTYNQLPKTFQWVSGSTHSFAWSSPVSGGSGVRYIWASTSGLSTKQSDSSFTVTRHGYVVATYRTQYSLTMSVNPSGGGTTTPAAGTHWYDPGSTVQISATASPGYVFNRWDGTGSGSYSGTANPATVTINGPISETANFAPLTATVTFTASGLSSDASGAVLTVDGVSYTYSQLPVSFTWVVGSQHSFSWSDPVSAGSGKRYAWVSTSGLSTAKSGTINVPSGGGSVAATYKTQYYLTMQVSPSGGGTASPGSGWYDAGSSVSISATPSSGYAFDQWVGSGSGSYTGTSNPATVTVNAPITQTAYFFSFSISVNPSSGSTSPGGIVTATVTVTYSSGYNSKSISFSASGLPSGASAMFNPSSVTISPGSTTATSTLTIGTSSSTPAGTYAITITGSGGGVSKSTTYTLTVLSMPGRWYLREHQTSTYYYPQIDFAKSSSSSLNIISYQYSIGQGYLFIVLPKSTLHGNKISIYWNIYYTYPDSRDLRLGAVYVLDTALAPDANLPITHIESMGYGLVTATHYPGPQGRSGWLGWRVDTSDALDLSSFTSNYVTLLVRLSDSWTAQTIILDIDYVQLLSPAGSVINTWEFAGSLTMQRVGTYEDYGYIDS